MLALIAFVASLVVWIVRLFGGDVDADWGFAFIAGGLALLVLDGWLPPQARIRRGA